eukprot:1735589-Amphidinium_carterae.1
MPQRECFSFVLGRGVLLVTKPLMKESYLELCMRLPVVIHCDNKSVVLGAQRVLAGRRVRRKEKHPELWDLLEQAVRPGLRVQKVKAHQQEPDQQDPAWYYWNGNRKADHEAGKALELEGEALLSRQRLERRVTGLREIWQLHIAIMLQQNEDVGRDFPPELILPAGRVESDARSLEGKAPRAKTDGSRPDYPQWLQDLVLEGMATLPGLCLGKKKSGGSSQEASRKVKERKIDSALALPLGCFVGEGHDLRSFRRADSGLEIGLVCMNCGAYTTGHWGLLKHTCVQDLGSRMAQVH